MTDEFTKAALYGIKTFNKKVKEKIGIEKLIELLNEYETPRSGVVYKSYDDYDGFFYGVDCDGETEIVWSDSLICSKKFGWIGWLVEQDKIDENKIIEKSEYLIEYRGNKIDQNMFQNTLLMLLSIQENPIEFLCSILE